MVPYLVHKTCPYPEPDKSNSSPQILLLKKGWDDAHNRPRGPKRVPDRFRIFLTFDTTRVVGRQPHAPAAFTPREIPWYSFLEAESTPGHMVPSIAKEKFPSVTSPGIDSETVRLVAQYLNHYATPGPPVTFTLLLTLSTGRTVAIEIN
jgi:hypothetical protein